MLLGAHKVEIVISSRLIEFFLSCVHWAFLSVTKSFTLMSIVKYLHSYTSFLFEWCLWCILFSIFLFSSFLDFMS